MFIPGVKSRSVYTLILFFSKGYISVQSAPATTTTVHEYLPVTNQSIMNYLPVLLETHRCVEFARAHACVCARRCFCVGVYHVANFGVVITSFSTKMK